MTDYDHPAGECKKCDFDRMIARLKEQYGWSVTDAVIEGMWQVHLREEESISDPNYWLMNYVQVRIGRDEAWARIGELELELLKAQLAIARHEVQALEAAIEQKENPYGW